MKVTFKKLYLPIVIVFLIVIIYYFSKAKHYDDFIQLKCKNKKHSTELRLYSEYEILQLIERHRQECALNESNVNSLRESITDGLLLGFLASIIVGDLDSAVEAALIWACIRCIMTGAHMKNPMLKKI
jgi:hypothetical protein